MVALTLVAKELQRSAEDDSRSSESEEKEMKRDKKRKQPNELYRIVSSDAEEEEAIKNPITGPRKSNKRFILNETEKETGWFTSSDIHEYVFYFHFLQASNDHRIKHLKKVIS